MEHTPARASSSVPERDYTGLSRFFGYLIVAAICIAAAISLIEYLRFNYERDKYQHAESVRLDLVSKRLGRDLSKVVTDLRRLAQSVIVRDYLSDDSQRNTERLNRELLNLVAHTSSYDQARFLDHEGRERARINYNNGAPTVVAQSELQDKQQRYYFKETIALAGGQVYLSPLDLNVEHGRIETPHKPIIRIATPLYRNNDSPPAGILILNYLADATLNDFEQFMSNSWGDAMLLNEHGYWLHSSDPSDEWGFMWSGGQSFAQRYPQAWHTIAANAAGTVETQSGLFIFASLKPRTAARLDASNVNHGETWKIVSHVAPTAWSFSLWQRLNRDPLVLAILVAISAGLSFLLAWLRVNNLQKSHALIESEERYRELFRQAADGIFIADLDGRYTDVNEAGCRMLGYSHHEIVGKSIVDTIPPEDVGRLQQAKERMLQGDSLVDEWTLHGKDGSQIPVEVSAKILSNHRWQGFVRDISERKRAEEQLRRAAIVFDSTMEAILVTDSERNIVAFNKAYTKMTGFESDEILGRNPHFHGSGYHDAAFYRALWQSLEESGQWQGEIWNRRKSGAPYPAWINISVVRDDSGQIVNYVAIMSDISSLKEVEQRLTHLAHHDVLTGLSNRLVFGAELELALERAKRHRRKVALLFLDLDRFKLINDTLGHAAGDELLKEIAKRISGSVRGDDLVARLGGDEFTVILEEIGKPRDAASIAQKIIDSINNPVALVQGEVTTSASIGISIFPNDAKDANDMAKAADAAMYRAKANGSNTYEFYTPQLTIQAEQRLSTEHGLRRALIRDDFTLHYQPQIEVDSGRIVGVEALVRWCHPELGLQLPDRFIRVAEESGVINQIGEWVFQEACLQAQRWYDAGIGPVRIALNVSGYEILHDNLVDRVRDTLHRAQLHPDDVPIQIEVTESMLASSSRVSETLTQLRKLGITIAIDDFGTGYSSLSRIKQLPVDVLKIDRSFLRNIPQDSDSRAIASAAILMGQSLGLEVVAEGIESEEQLDFVKTQRCDIAQGYLLGKPLPGDQTALLLKRGVWQSAPRAKPSLSPRD